MDQHNKKQRARWFLESASDPENKWLFPIEPIPFTIGRDNDCDLTLRSGSVSRRHAQINLSGSLLWIRDLGSTNGTLLNRKRIADAEILEPGAILHFGKVAFSLRNMAADGNDAADHTKTVLIDRAEMLASPKGSYARQFEKMIHDRAVAPHFQPILNLYDRNIKGYEILGRVPADGRLPPDPVDLFNMAVFLNLESELSSLFREEGVRLGTSLPGFPVLFVNTHPVELIRISNLERSLRKIREFTTSTTIVLEISEKAVTDLEEMKRLRSTLKELDIGLAFDDFGVGQTRLIELAKFPPDFLKFDSSLIHMIHLAPQKLHQLIVTFLNMARDIGINTVAEGIECGEEGEICRQLGFDFAQGDFYGAPQPLSKLDISQKPDEVRA